LLSFLAASTAPTPLYHLYQEQLQFSAAMLTLIFGVYALSLLAALLTVGSLSDHLGRKPVIFTAVLLNAGDAAVYQADSVAWLISARVLQGFATGMATAVLSATLLDTDRQQGPLINSVAPLIGMALGGMGCGLLAEFAPAPLHLTYWLLLALFVLQALYVWRLPETSRVSRGMGVIAANPACAGSGALDLVACAAAEHRNLGARRFLRLPGAFAGAHRHGLDLEPDRRRDRCRTDIDRCFDDFHPAQSACRQGIAVGGRFVGNGVLLILLGVHSASLPLFFLGTLVAGCGFGAGFLGAVRSVVPLALPHERAGLMSAYYVLSYLAFCLPALLAGHLTTEGYGVVLILLALGAWLAHWLRRSSGASASGQP
jgi:MFS family permease